MLRPKLLAVNIIKIYCVKLSTYIILVAAICYSVFNYKEVILGEVRKEIVILVLFLLLLLLLLNVETKRNLFQ